LPLDALRSFEAAARHTNFAKAAAEIGVTPSAISHQVRRLEQYIGVQLFEREQQRTRLSVEGIVLAQCLLKSFDEIQETIGSLSLVDDRSLVISVMAAFAAKWLAPRLPEFASLQPELQIKLLVNDNLTDFGAEKVDFGIRFGRGNYPGLQSTLLFPADYVPVCSPSLRSAGQSGFRYEDLRSIRLIHDESASRAPDLPTWNTWLSTVGMGDVAGRRGLIFQSPELAIDAAISGHGAALGILPLVADDLKAGRLIIMFDERVRGPFSFWTVYPTAKRNVEKILTFAHWLEQAAKK
jgi:LysR family glycine cleavage system transcriptional activator